ncbi:MAG: hypothetical protein AAFV95_21580 [Bacteroidota bacterium]
MSPFVKFCLLSGCCLLLASSSAQTVKKFKLPTALQEVSGLTYAGPDSLWWISDSGSPAVLFRTNNRGKMQEQIDLSTARNVDWEDLSATPDRSTFYIGDFGNNRNKRRNLKIYIYQPNARQLDSIEFDYPDQTAFPPLPAAANFDMEAFFYHRDSLHLFSKNRVGKGNDYTKHYVLPARPGRYTAQLRDSIYLKNRVVTAAAISPDGKTVALLSYTYKKVFGFLPYSNASVFLMRDFSGQHFLQGNVYRRRIPHFLLSTQLESLDFIDNTQCYIASEQTSFVKPYGKRLRIKKRHFKPSKRIHP